MKSNISQKRLSNAKRTHLTFQDPQSLPDTNTPARDEWIEQVFKNFVALSKTNKVYYKVILELLWPKGHGIPGPLVSQEEIRAAIDKYRSEEYKGNKPLKPYIDVFRRLRELQGEEGLLGIMKNGNKYQLSNLEIEKKRIHRTKVTNEDWTIILSKYNNSCAVCRRKPPEVQFQPDHKIPRLRHGDTSSDNTQPLCKECNNFKSTACRNCELDCLTCSWAFPERYKPLRITNENLNKLRERAILQGIDPDDLINSMINQYLDNI